MLRIGDAVNAYTWLRARSQVLDRADVFADGLVRPPPCDGMGIGSVRFPGKGIASFSGAGNFAARMLIRSLQRQGRRGDAASMAECRPRVGKKLGCRVRRRIRRRSCRISIGHRCRDHRTTSPRTGRCGAGRGEARFRREAAALSAEDSIASRGPESLLELLCGGTIAIAPLYEEAA